MAKPSDPKQAPKVVIEKALKDEAFRAELLKNPNAAVEKALGIKLPKGLTVKVVEDGPAVTHLVLPPAPPKGGELSDAELEKAAGGYGGGMPGGCPTYLSNPFTI